MAGVLFSKGAFGSFCSPPCSTKPHNLFALYKGHETNHIPPPSLRMHVALHPYTFIPSQNGTRYKGNSGVLWVGGGSGSSSSSSSMPPHFFKTVLV